MNEIDKVTARNAVNHLQRTPGKPNQTIRELKRNSGLSESFLRGLKKEGLLPGFQVGTWFYVDVPRFEEYLNSLDSGGNDYEKGRFRK